MRLLVHGAADGAANMAIDETLLHSAARDPSTLTLRVYRFDAPTLTFGYAQKLTEAGDGATCRRLGIERVRRITGGRALLHHHEITYSVTGPPVASSPKSTYAAVNAAISNALKRLGVPLDTRESHSSERAPSHLPCLAVPTGHEITVNGEKLVASAMRFRRKAFLQHGSILTSVDRNLSERVTHANGSVLRAIGLQELDVPVDDSRLAVSLTDSFSDQFRASVHESALSNSETEQASRLEMKYRSRDWTDGRSRLFDNSEAVC